MLVKRTFTFLSIVALACAAIFGVIAYGRASAQEATPTEPSTGSSSDSALTRPGLGRGVKGGYSSEDLAAALGITVEALNTAYTTASDAALTQAVEAGLITQAQADQIRQNGSAFPFGRRWGGWLSQNGIDYDALLADALGISVEELQAAYAQAHNARIDQAVADGRLTQEQADLLKGEYALYNNPIFQSSLQSAFEAAVNQAVSAGVITQAQADQILANRSNPWSRGFHGLGGFGGGRGRHGGFGFRGLPGVAPDSQPVEPETPTGMPSNGL